MELICPICGLTLDRVERGYRCERSHSFDMARQGYVNLLPVQQKRSLHPGDTREQVLGRRAFLESGCYAPISDTLNETARTGIWTATPPRSCSGAVPTWIPGIFPAPR